MKSVMCGPLYLTKGTPHFICRGGKVCCFSDGHEECYYDYYPYFHLPLPECPATFELEMLLYTRDNPDNGTLINKQAVPYVSNKN